MNLSRSGRRRDGVRFGSGLISANGIPRFSMTNVSPLATRLTISLVLRWRSRTLAFFLMWQSVTHPVDVVNATRRNTAALSAAPQQSKPKRGYEELNADSLER